MDTEGKKIEGENAPMRPERRPTDSFVEFFGQEVILQLREPTLLCRPVPGAPVREVPLVTFGGQPAQRDGALVMQRNWPVQGQMLDDGAAYTVTIEKAVIMPSSDRGRLLVMYNIDGALMQLSVAPADVVAVTKVAAVAQSSLVTPGSA